MKIYFSSSIANNVTIVPHNDTCVGENQSLGALVPGNHNHCCPGLVPYIENFNKFPREGSRGICIRNPIIGYETVTGNQYVSLAKYKEPEFYLNVTTMNDIVKPMKGVKLSDMVFVSIVEKQGNKFVKTNAPRSVLEVGKEGSFLFNHRMINVSLINSSLTLNNVSNAILKITSEKTNIQASVHPIPTPTPTPASTSTCSDSDMGSDYYIAGTVSGKINGISYKHSDYCSDSSHLVEYFCNSDRAYTKSVHTCSSGCQDGECFMPENATQTMIRIGSTLIIGNYNGTTNYLYVANINNSYVRFNVMAGNSIANMTPIASKMSFTLADGQGLYTTIGNFKIGINIITIGYNGSTNIGAYITVSSVKQNPVTPSPTPPGPIVKSTCTDSDYGQNYYVSGTVSGLISGKSYKYSDYCSNNNTLVEYSCNDLSTYTKTTTYSCSNGCQDGECFMPSVSKQTFLRSGDTLIVGSYNGTNYYLYVKNINNSYIRFNVMVGSSIKSMVPIADKMSFTLANGQGFKTTIGNHYINLDQVTIGYTSAESIGAYVKISSQKQSVPAPTPTPKQFCNSTNSGELLYTSLPKQDTCVDASSTNKDTCVNGNEVKQYYCVGGMTGSCDYTTYNCQAYGYNACRNGACVNMPAPTPTPVPPVPTPTPTNTMHYYDIDFFLNGQSLHVLPGSEGTIVYTSTWWDNHGLNLKDGSDSWNYHLDDTYESCGVSGGSCDPDRNWNTTYSNGFYIQDYDLWTNYFQYLSNPKCWASNCRYHPYGVEVRFYSNTYYPFNLSGVDNYYNGVAYHVVQMSNQ